MKTAIIGLGNIATVHALYLKELGVKISCVCDKSIEKANAFLADCKIQAPIYTNYIEMLDIACPDIVHICTPHYLHKEMIVECLKRDINVLCEKPMCIKVSDIDEIVKAEKQSKAILGICHQNRFNDATQELKKFLKDKKITSLFGSVAWHRTAEYYTNSEWRGTKEFEGGSVLINQALHTLDIAQWLTGMPKSCTATVNNFSLKDVIQTEDTASAFYQGDVDFSFFATNTAGKDMPVTISVLTDSGDRAIMFGEDLYINSQVVVSKNCVPGHGKACYGRGHYRAIESFYDCVKNKVKFLIDGAEGGKVVKLILSAYKSNGQKIDIE